MRTALPILISLSLTLVTGCERRSKFGLDYHENQFASMLARTIEFSHHVSGTDSVLTNLLGITNVVTLESLASYERIFLTFGKKAGFTNSLLEKYVALPLSSNVVDPNGERIVLMAAQTFERDDGRLGRMCISQKGSNYGGGWIDEEKVQQGLRKANVTVPVPSTAPSMRWLNDPEGTQAALQKQFDIWFAEEERLNPPPFWYRRSWQITGATVLLCGVLYGFYRLVKRP